MAIRLDEYNRVCVLSIEGDFAGDEPTDFRRVLESRAEEGRGMNVVVDFEKCPYLNSDALESLLFARRRCQEKGGRLSLANLDKNCQKVLEVTRLTRHFEFHATLAGAMKN